MLIAKLQLVSCLAQVLCCVPVPFKAALSSALVMGVRSTAAVGCMGVGGACVWSRGCSPMGVSQVFCEGLGLRRLAL